MADELISRQAVKDAFHAYMVRRFDKDRCADAENCEVCERRCLWHEVVASVSAVDAVEVVHGRWKKMGEADYKCSVCGFRFTSCDPVSMFLHCRCGAKMDGERREENVD